MNEMIEQTSSDRKATTGILHELLSVVGGRSSSCEE
jgi:hypothetical protein